MTKEQLIKKTEVFMNQALQANCYYLISEQFLENKNKYHEEMLLSSAFYSYTYNALIVAVFMELSKIFDNHKQSSNIEDLYNDCFKNITLFPKENMIEEITFPFRHTIKEEEEAFFRIEIRKQKELYSSLGIESSQITVEMSIERYFELFQWRLLQIETQRKNLLKQRNKVYAHNDEATMKTNLDEIINEFALSTKEIKSLISFSLDFCTFAFAMLTGINKVTSPINIGDWENTLRMARLGEKYKDIEIQKQVDDFRKSLEQDL